MQKHFTHLNEKERKELKMILIEGTRSLERIDSERAALKDLIEEAHAKFGLKKPVIRKLINAIHKQNIADMLQETEELTTLYEVLIKGKMDDGEE